MGIFDNVFDDESEVTEQNVKLANGTEISVKNKNGTPSAANARKNEFKKKMRLEYQNKLGDPKTTNADGSLTLMPKSEFFNDYLSSSDYNETVNHDGSSTFNLTPEASAVFDQGRLNAKDNNLQAPAYGSGSDKHGPVDGQMKLDTIQQMYEGAGQSVIDSAKGLQYKDGINDVTGSTFFEAMADRERINATNKAILRGVPELPGAIIDTVGDVTGNDWNTTGAIRSGVDSVFGEAELTGEDGRDLTKFVDQGRTLGTGAAGLVIPLKNPAKGVKTKIEKQEIKAAIKGNEAGIVKLNKNAADAKVNLDAAKKSKPTPEVIKKAKERVVKANEKVKKLDKEVKSTSGKANVDAKMKLTKAKQEQVNAKKAATSKNLNANNKAVLDAAKIESKMVNKKLKDANRINNNAKKNLNELDNPSATATAAKANDDVVIRDRVSIFEQGLTGTKNAAKATAKATTNVLKNTKQIFPFTSKAFKTTAVMSNVKEFKDANPGVEVPNARTLAKNISKAYDDEKAARAAKKIAADAQAARVAVSNPEKLEEDYGIDLGRSLFQIALAALLGVPVSRSLDGIGRVEEDKRKHREEMELKAQEARNKANAASIKAADKGRKEAMDLYAKNRKEVLDKNLKQISTGGFKNGEEDLLNPQLYGLFDQLDKMRPPIDYGRNDIQQAISKAVSGAKMSLSKGGWFDSDDDNAAKANITGRFFDSLSIVSKSSGILSRDGSRSKDTIATNHAAFTKWMLQQEEPENSVQGLLDDFNHLRKSNGDAWGKYHDFAGWAMGNLRTTGRY